MKEYELVVLVHPDLEADMDTALNKIRGIITSANGQIVSEENWGKKKLAYQIKKQEFAVYVCFNLQLPASAPLKISNVLNITEEVLRYLLVAVDEKSKKALEEAKENAKEAEEAAKEE